MDLAKAITTLSAQFQSPLFELPGFEVQKTMTLDRRVELIQSYTGEYKQSAVMFLIYPDEENQAKLVFFERSKIEGDVHGGQIGLPGGRYEPKDRNLIQTAIRETEEEIGCVVDSEKIIGRLTPLMIPVSNYEVTPVIGYVDEQPTFHQQDDEVARIIEFYLDDVLQAEIKTGEFMAAGKYKVNAPFYSIHGERVWGATSMMLAEFIALF